jgi:uncharacterized protein YciI
MFYHCLTEIAQSDHRSVSSLLRARRGTETAERFVESDPYVANGVVSSYRIRDWNVVIGE